MTAYRLKKGYVTNPLTIGKVRNLPCPCGSTKKVKACCGAIKFVNKSYADKATKWIKATDNIPREEMDEVMKIVTEKQLEIIKEKKRKERIKILKIIFNKLFHLR